MNKNSKAVIAISCISVLSLPFLLSLKRNSEIKVEAYEVGTLPTTIYLRDNSDSEIRNYYSGLNSLSTSERQGNNLLKNLKNILKDGQVYYSYDTSNLWAMYEITDRDWDKSPASDLNKSSSATYGEGNFDEENNVITNYKYGKSMSSHSYDPYIHALYVNRDVDNQTTAWSDHNQDQWGINQEHIWPKSQGFEASGKGGARGDPMHLWAGNGRVNGTEHNNHPYGFVNKSKSTTNPVTAKGWTNLSGNYLGESQTLGSLSVFEPQDSDKGDIARAIFYMVARYNYISGEDADGINANNPNLELVQAAPEKAKYTSTETIPGQMGILSDLLEWNRLDPPDEWEIHRNNLLFNNYTKNRNPFIDFPEWAEYIWGSAEDGEYNPTVTGYATPSKDTISDFGTDTLEISENEIILRINDTYKVTATTTADVIDWISSDESVIALDKAWSSSNEEVTITGLSAGNAVLTASINDGAITAECNVEVTAESEIHVSSVTLSEKNLEKGTNENFKLNYEILPHNATNKEVTFTSSNPNVATTDNEGNVSTLAVGETTITIKTVDGNLSDTCLIKVIVPLKSITVENNNLQLFVGEESAIKYTLNPEDATYKDVTFTSSNVDVAKVDSNGKITAVKDGEATITVKGHGDVEAKVTVTVKTETFIDKALRFFNNLPTGGKIGIIAGVVLVIGLIILILVLSTKARKAVKKQAKKQIKKSTKKKK